ncbi:MAG: hypothetical protein ABUL48_05290, partial [Pseudorhodoplanes sp.]
ESVLVFNLLVGGAFVVGWLLVSAWLTGKILSLADSVHARNSRPKIPTTEKNIIQPDTAAKR